MSSTLTHLQQKYEELQESYDLLSEKIRRLKRNSLIEDNEVTRFKFEEMLVEAERERKNIEEELIRCEVSLNSLKKSMPTKAQANIQLILEGDLSEFDEEKRKAIIDILSKVLEVDTQNISILSVRSGSIVIELKVPEELKEGFVITVRNNRQLEGEETHFIVKEAKVLDNFNNEGDEEESDQDEIYQQQLLNEFNNLQKEYDLLSEKLHRLRKERIIQAGVDIRFQLEKQIENCEAERNDVEKKMKELR